MSEEEAEVEQARATEEADAEASTEATHEEEEERKHKHKHKHSHSHTHTHKKSEIESKSDEEKNESEKQKGEESEEAAKVEEEFYSSAASPVVFQPEELAWVEQKQSMLLLLRARMLLSKLVHEKFFAERSKTGDLSAIEVVRLMQSMQEAQETDFVTEISALKRNLLGEIRKANEMGKEVQDLDKAISLLIGHVATTRSAAKKEPHKVKNATQGATNAITPQKLEKYSNFFYLLQTEPVYLAKLMCAIEEPEEVRQLLDIIIFSLYGNAFSPREEYLLLLFFREAIDQVMSHVIRIMDFVKQTFLPDMVLTYNKRKQGQDYLAATLTPVMKQFLAMKPADQQFELNPKMINDALLTEEEIETGVKSTKRNLSEAECAEQPEVIKETERRIKNLQAICVLFFNQLVDNVNNLPYGLRWICHQIHSIAKDAFPTSENDEINRLTVHFVYFKFINLGIVSPDTFLNASLGQEAVFGLLQISKVLYNVFNLTKFHHSSERWMLPLNDWIQQRTEIVRKYLYDVIAVDPPEDVLQVDRYKELTQMVKPIIVISPSEMATMHSVFKSNSGEFSLKSTDSLVVILKELGPVETYNDNTDIQLTLVNRFPSAEAVLSQEKQLYNQTKALVMQLLRQLPPEVVPTDGDTSLLDLLDAGKKYCKQQGNSQLKADIVAVQKNLKKLESDKQVSKEGGYRDFFHDVTLDIANRQQVREQQKKEILRLQASLRSVLHQQKFFNEQITQYKRYRTSCRVSTWQQKLRRGKRSGAADAGKAGGAGGPFKFSYLELVKKGVIVKSQVPKPLQKATKFMITCPEPGVFDIEVSISGVKKGEPISLLLDDLLDKKSKNVEHDDREQVVLDVNMTIHLLNSLH
eukprot:TRINITY_DN298_c0_g2_i2.p1 TRINITY_DN298_c0_g2~~TRINITY_DN298_c0_g2_i2.p1  ORF type:complete len:865 (-),score=322.37 TRINITY_DN298_c0_g2_i2:77-2671(-)